MAENLVQPIYNLDESLKFLKKTKDGKYAQIEKSSLNYLRLHVEEQHIDEEEQEYWYSFDC